MNKLMEAFIKLHNLTTEDMLRIVEEAKQISVKYKEGLEAKKIVRTKVWTRADIKRRYKKIKTDAELDELVAYYNSPNAFNENAPDTVPDTIHLINDTIMYQLINLNMYKILIKNKDPYVKKVVFDSYINQIVIPW
ncbi:MAG: hypothetical protein PHY48_04130 [Candidatus Cloacimonetes bacterium]|nr:hypothetical protein [Candidatus Cloacimonadota bacterium]